MVCVKVYFKRIKKVVKMFKMRELNSKSIIDSEILLMINTNCINW
jgi:hypothetical protein